MRSLVWRAVVGLATFSLACGAGSDAQRDAGAADAPAGTDSGGIVVEIGTGSSSFVELPPRGARVELVMGPQGGWHVFGRARFRGVSDDVRLRFRLLSLDGREVLSDTGLFRRRDRMGLTRAGDGYESASAELVILGEGRRPADVDGRSWTLELTVEETTTSRSSTASREITIVDAEP